MISKEEGESFRARLSGVIAQDGRAHADIARAIGEAPQLMSKWLNTNALTRLPAANYVLKLADCLGVNVRWLISGEGPKNAPFEGDDSNTIEIPYLRANVVDTREQIEELRCPNSALVNEDFRSKVNIKVFDTKDPIIYKKDYLISLGANPDYCMKLRVSGDSMDPLIRSGDSVIVDCSARTVTNNCVYALVYDNSICIRRLIKQLSKLVIRADNPVYPEEVLTVEEANKIEVLGRVIERNGRL